MSARWSADKANAWYAGQSWLLGVNYVPSTAVNSTECWQVDTFDAATIQRELALAAATGLNSCRVFLQELVWEHDPDALKTRFAVFLDIAARQGISVMPVLFDDCAFDKHPPCLGRQDEPLPDRMMTAWTASPGHARSLDRANWPTFERYITDLLHTFGHDERVLLWDLFNEPGNEGMGDASLPLVAASFAWARAADPQQPLSIGIWDMSQRFAAMNAVLAAQSDIITFHQYAGVEQTEALLDSLAINERPCICTEWMARPLDSRVSTHLPLFYRRHVGCYLWGFVNGRTQTHLPWPFLHLETPEWFHDLYHPTGEPYDPREIELLRQYGARKPGGNPPSPVL